MKITRRSLFPIAVAIAIASAAQAAISAPIVVGQVGPMSGLSATEGRAYNAGMELYFKQVNKAGGVNGNPVTLVSRDDAGQPAETVSMTRELLATDRPLVLAGYIGNRNVAELIASGILGSEKIALVGYRALQIRHDVPFVYNVRASVQDELQKMTEHLATIGITRLGLLYEDGPEASELVSTTQQAANKAGAQLVAQAPYPPGTAKVATAVARFAKAPSQAILMVATGAAAGAFIEEYRAAGGTAQLFAYSGADVEQMAKRLSEEQMKGVAIAQVMPNPYRISSRISKELNELVAKSGNTDVPVSYAMMEGFIAGKVIVEAARRQGRTPTREGMVKALESLDNFDVGGLAIGFKPGRHTGSHYVELSIVTDAGRVRQ